MNEKETENNFPEAAPGEETSEKIISKNSDFNSAETDQPLKNAESNNEKTERKEPENQLEELKKKNLEINDKYLRLYSDFDNFRKRNAKEKIDIIKFAGQELISLMLPVLDDFERAMKATEGSPEKGLNLEGIQLIFQKLKNTLLQEGLREMEIKEGEFNSELHEAITKVTVQEKDLKGKIIDVLEKGYYLNDKVIRHAKVVIGN